MNTESAPFAPSSVDEVLQRCMSFDIKWRDGKQPRIEDYLNDIQEPALTRLLHYLLEIEISELRKNSEPFLADYLTRFPRHQEIVRELFDARPTSPGGIDVGTGTVEEVLVPAHADRPAYEIIERLGAGGMGIVYKARQVNIDRIVALKMIKGEIGDQAMAQFSREVRYAAKLDHPHIIKIHDYGVHQPYLAAEDVERALAKNQPVWIFNTGQPEGQPYYTMEYVEGENLYRTLARKPFPVRKVVPLLIALTDAVSHMHKRGLIHRDLKPQNVLIAANGSVKLADFGLTRDITTGPHLQHPASFVGTLPYMAPEQATGRDIGPRTDVYGLGAILYEMLTGRPPFDAIDHDVLLEMVRTRTPDKPSMLNFSVPDNLDRICMKCLRKVPTDRYGSAEELLQEFEAFLKGQSSEDFPLAPPGYHIREEVGHNQLAHAYLVRSQRPSDKFTLKVIRHDAAVQAIPLIKAAKGMVGLHHENIAQIHKVGVMPDKRSYVIREWVDGVSLMKKLTQGPLSARAAAELVKALAEGVHAAHQHGILHRHLTPATVLVTNQGTPKIIDFGLADQQEFEDGNVSGGSFFAARYLAPEQARDEPTDRRTDVYALGAILYVLLTGQAPASGGENFLEIMTQIEEEIPAPPSHRHVGLAPALDRICQKCLHKVPGQRYPGADAVAADLGLFLNPK